MAPIFAAQVRKKKYACVINEDITISHTARAISGSFVRKIVKGKKFPVTTSLGLASENKQKSAVILN